MSSPAPFGGYPDQIRAHGGKVNQAAEGVKEAVTAANEVHLSVGSFGLLVGGLIFPHADSAQKQGMAALKELSTGLEKIVEGVDAWASHLEGTEHGLALGFTQFADLLED